MKVVFPTCCGVDVHKTFVVATIITTPTDSLQPRYWKKRFSTFNSDLNRFADWLLEHNCLDVCMESTGKYWVPVFNILEKRGIRVVVANPKWVKAVKGNKDDAKDSKWIGNLFRLGLVPGSYIPSKKSIFCGNLQGIAISLFPAVPVKRTDIRMLLRSVMLR